MTYAAELKLCYKGSKQEKEKYPEGHAHNIGIVSVFLEVNPVNEHQLEDELEKLINGWEMYQRRQYKCCGVKYDERSCSLNQVDSFIDGSISGNVNCPTECCGPRNLQGSLILVLLTKPPSETTKKVARMAIQTRSNIPAKEEAK